MSEGQGPLSSGDKPRSIVDDSPMTQQSGYEPMGRTDNEGRSVADAAQDKAMEYGDAARNGIATGKDSAVEGLRNAAGKIRERAGGDGMTAQTSGKVADTMERTAGYLHDHETGEIIGDIERYVRDHPMRAVAGAAIGGFIIGRMLR